MSTSGKDQLTVSNKNESTTGSNKSVDSSQSDDSFKSSRTSVSNENDPLKENDVKIISSNESTIKDTSKDLTHDYLNDSTNDTSKDDAKEISNDHQSKDERSDENSSKIDQTESTPSSSSIDLELLISNLEISDENNELTNSLINLIHKRSSLHESEIKSKNQSKKLSLASLDMNGLVDYIKEKKCSKIIVMIGAGVSTSSGIPDFRSSGSGIFAKLKKYKLRSPECVFEINYFKTNPKPFFELGAEIFTSKKYKPTPTHYFIKLLDQKGLLLRLYTQNIDGLEAESGLSDEKVTYAHGSFNKSHCLACNYEYDFEFIKKFMSEERKEVEVPKCEKCNKKPNNIIKPDIVFYGQKLPEVFFERLSVDFPECDLLLIMGTSLVVQPFAGLVNEVKPNVPRILINRERTGEFLKYESCYNLRSGATEKSSDRDIFLQGDCDSVILDIVDQLGWKIDLEKLMNRQK